MLRVQALHTLFSSFLTNTLSYDLFHTFLREVGNLILEGIHSSGNHCTNLVARGSLRADVSNFLCFTRTTKKLMGVGYTH